jgi:hypothetical protein
MRFGALEIVLIVAVLLSVAVIWRWWRQGQSGADESYGGEVDEGRQPSFFGRLGTIGILLVLAGLGLIVISYMVVIGLAKMFIWAVAIVLLGVAFMLLSRR